MDSSVNAQVALTHRAETSAGLTDAKTSVAECSDTTPLDSAVSSIFQANERTADAGGAQDEDPSQVAAQIRSKRAKLTDEMLMRRIAVDRDPDAFSELYDRFSTKVYSLLLHIVRTEEDAQDLLQEVFLLLWQKAPDRYNGSGSVNGWITALARHRAVDELRSKLYRDRGRETGLLLDERPEIEALLADNRQPDGPLHRADVSREVRKAMNILTPEQRAIIDLAYFGGLTHSEISAKLSIPLGSVKTKMRIAVLKLKKKLTPLF